MEPIFFVPFFEEKHWGGSRLSALFGKYPEGIRIAESWEMSAVQYRQTFVRNGKYTGYMLSELYKKNRELFGTESTYFPFVIKLLDFGEQSPAVIHGGGLKAGGEQYEGWYVVKAEAGAQMMTGTKLTNGLALFNAIAADTVMESAYVTEVHEGESFVAPPGILHSIGPGQVYYEISSPLRESSQIYNWGRLGEQPFEQALDAFRFGEPVKRQEQREILPGLVSLLETDLFRLEKVDAAEPVAFEKEAVFSVYTALIRGTITTDSGVYRFGGGDTFMIPANSESYAVTGGRLLKATPKTL
ncbi:MAG: hypothetical protein LBS85_03895 [Clostridiales Family XIII bacterium]|jgi:mannose-6-phosphate isomerase|nr:hypothetical protein [Clostridiales Family XIII bacterium]